MDVEYFVRQRGSYSQVRATSRFPSIFPVRVVGTNGPIGADEARDISETGIGVSTKHPLQPMTLVALQLQIPESAERVEVLSRVMWNTDSAMGLRFEQPDERVVRWVRQLRARR